MLEATSRVFDFSNFPCTLALQNYISMKLFILSTFVVLMFSSRIFAQTIIDVAENTFKVSGLGEEIFYYGLAEGDQLIFNFEEKNGKELKEMEISELPSTSKFMDYKTDKIQDKKITITNTGIYKFRFTNSALSGRICKIKIQRIPAEDFMKKFNSEVYWKMVYDTIYSILQEKYLVKKEYLVERLVKEQHYINSGSNALFRDGKSRITIPVNLPSKTVEWYYTFSASRSAQDIEKIHGKIDLAAELTRVVDPSGALKIGVGMLTTPPGENVCDIYLLDNDNRSLFEAKTAFQHYPIGSRENLTSGTVQIKEGGSATYILGVKNPDATYGINLTIEVDAIVVKEEWGVRDVKKNNITSRKVAYLKN